MVVYDNKIGRKTLFTSEYIERKTVEKFKNKKLLFCTM